MGRKVTQLAGFNNYAPGVYKYYYRFDDTGETFEHHEEGLEYYEEDILQVIDHTTACIMDGLSECSCPASSVRIRL